MGIVATDTARNVANRAAEPPMFWRRMSRALDRLVVRRSRDATSAMALRRSKYDFDRCRRLMLQGSNSSVSATINRVRSLRAVTTAQHRP